MNNIQLENGRINLEGLDGIGDHLKALAIANKTLDSIKASLNSAEDKKSEWYRRATTAHKSWFWMRSRICERLAVLRHEEKEFNRMRRKFEKEELLILLSQQHTKSVLRAFRLLAEAKAEQRLQQILNQAVENG
ncbi:hypothetical protein [Cronobacter turicensis]|uniref:hypothetical protein n=1 Tax=Cronobacter turicensis TaxID=413502 RepID=UPI0011AD7A55|nr:hypothetical protein [Cronobacter turicensis]ELU8454246.1 hypothetical protein [Cronobacter turicensis]EMA1790352.1 hypothetical protein [Cronobacter turicensis]EMA1799328.1 hypothetical protein [Cronobacter turicensis]EMA1847629.1 hypothetical protein [Cronobacter turicensis]EMA1857874.1 hypothetical protein [Cronobacter turicensis]